MPGFYEAIVRADGPLTAMWITEGENAGARALLDRQGVLFRDEAFPADMIPDSALDWEILSQVV